MIKQLGIGMLGGLLAALLVQSVMMMTAPKHPRYVTVDFIAVVHEQIEALRQRQNAGESISIDDHGQVLEKALDDMAREYDVIVLARQAVLSGNIPDFTEVLRERVRRELSTNTPTANQE